MGGAKNWAMELEDRGFGDVEGSVCVEHIEDPELAANLADVVDQLDCIVCGRAEPEGAQPFAVLAEAIVEQVVESMRFLYSDATSVLSWDSEDQQYVGSTADTWEAVDSICEGAFDDAADQILIELIRDAIGDDKLWTGWFSGIDVDDLTYRWDAYAETIKHTSRLLIVDRDGGDVVNAPGSVAGFLDELRVYVEGNLGLVQTIDAGRSFYRGRLTDDVNTIRATSKDLGPAPKGKATANRMSPAGISYFYASIDAETAIAEIAGHGVEPYAVVGEFRSARELTVLNLTGRPSRPSVFDVGRRNEIRMAAFLDSFVGAITTPVIPDGRQHVEYAPTQVLTEYLRFVPSRQIDGIVLPSAQTQRPTYVLLGLPRVWLTPDL